MITIPFCRRHIKKIEIQPIERTKTMKDMMKAIETKGAGPCGGFTMMYACMCDLHSLAFRAEVEWVRYCMSHSYSVLPGYIQELRGGYTLCQFADMLEHFFDMF